MLHPIKETCVIVVDLANPFYKGDDPQRIKNAIPVLENDLNEERDLLLSCVKALRPAWKHWGAMYGSRGPRGIDHSTEGFDMADIAQNERIRADTHNRLTDSIVWASEARLLPPEQFAKLLTWFRLMDGEIRIITREGTL